MITNKVKNIKDSLYRFDLLFKDFMLKNFYFKLLFIISLGFIFGYTDTMIVINVFSDLFLFLSMYILISGMFFILLNIVVSICKTIINFVKKKITSIKKKSQQIQ
jgi:uncharacterized membrane protein